MAQMIDDRRVYVPPPPPPPIPPPPPHVPPAQPQETLHPVVPQDTLASIGERYRVAPERIAERNRLENPDILDPGTTLVVPTGIEHPSPVTPAATPEQARVDTTLQDNLLARDNLAAMQGTSGQNGGQPWPADAIAAQQTLVDDTGTALQTAIGDEIVTRLTAAGEPVNAETIQQSGDALAQRYANDPAAQAIIGEEVVDVRVDHEVDTALTAATWAPYGANPNNLSDAQLTVNALDDALPTLSPEAQTALLASPRFDTLVDNRVAPAFTAPLQGEPWQNSDGGQVEVRESIESLRTLTAGTDPRLATELVDRGLTALEGLNTRSFDAGYGMMVGPEGTRALEHIASDVGGTPAGDALVRRMAELPVNGLTIGQGVAEGASPDLILAVAANGGGERIYQQAIDGVNQFNANQVASNVDALAKHTEELTWYIANHGAGMTPEQLNDAIAGFTREMGPAWEARTRELEAQVAQDGERLLDQIDTLRTLPAGLEGQQGNADQAIGGILGDQKSQYAISLALRENPAYIDTTAGRRLMQETAYEAKFGEQGLKFARELANTYVRHNVLSAAQNFDPTVPGSRADAVAAIERLRSPQLAAMLGISAPKLGNAVDALKLSLPTGVETAERIAGRLDELNLALTTEDMKPAFDRREPAGQLIRTLGLTFAAVGFANSTDRALADPTLKNGLRAITDAAALGQKGSELLVGLNRISDDSLFGRFGSTASGRVFGILSAGFDGWSAGESFSQGDWVRGGLYTASAAGGVLAATSGTGLAASLGIGAWAGPVGLALVGISALGLAAKDSSDHANRFQHDETNGRSTRFLAHAGLDEDTARLLVDNSGDGHSPVTLLARYAESKGYDFENPVHQDQFATWLNDMPHDQLDHVRDWMHNSLDEFEGDVGRLGDDRTVILSEGTVTSRGGVAVVMDNPRTVGQIDALIGEYGATPLPTV